MSYRTIEKNFKNKQGKSLRRRLIIREEDGDETTRTYSIANKYLGIFLPGNHQYHYTGDSYVRDVASFLDYLDQKGIDVENFFDKVSIDDANDYMLDYCETLLPDGDYPGSTARIRKRKSLGTFLINIRNSGINPNLLGHFIYSSTGHQKYNGNREKIESEIIMVKEADENMYKVNRYCPSFFVDSFMKWAKITKPNAWIAANFEYYGGIRPAEACNLRHPNSEWGGNIECIIQHERIIGMNIDLTRQSWECPLRSDGIPVGYIKRLRNQFVLPDYLEPLYEAYYEYLNLTENCRRESYGPLIIQKRKSSTKNVHMAYRYENYLQDFQIICEKYVFPELKAMGGEKEAFVLGMKKGFMGPHMFRHGFTCRLVEAGYPWNIIQVARGDSPNNPDTAALYTIKGGALQTIAGKVDNVITRKILEQNTFPRML